MDDPGLAGLRPREREVLELMAQGCSNAAIAGRLCLSAAAVEKYVSGVFTKLGLAPTPVGNRRVLAVLRYLESGGHAVGVTGSRRAIP